MMRADQSETTGAQAVMETSPASKPLQAASRDHTCGMSLSRSFVSRLQRPHLVYHDLAVSRESLCEPLHIKTASSDYTECGISDERATDLIVV